VVPALSLRVAARDPWLYAIALFSIVYCIPAFRLVASLSDEGIILHGAARLLEGQVLYRDFFEIIGPGTFLVSAAWLKVFGSSFAAIRVLSVATVTLIAILTYLTARAVSAHRAIALALALVFLVRAPQDLNHHWFTTTAAMAAALSLLTSLHGARFLWLACFTTGVFAGLAAMFTQSRGGILAIGILAVLLTLPDRNRRLASTVAGMAMAPAAATIYLASVGALRAAIEETLVFPSQRYSANQSVPFGAFSSFSDSGMVSFLPLTLLLALVTLGTELRQRPHFRISLVLAFVAFIGAYPRPDVTHLTYVMPLATPMFALALTALLGKLESRFRLTLTAALIGLCLWHVGSSVMGRVSMARRPRQEIATARGVVERYQDFWARDFAWLVAGIQQHTTPDDRFFFYPNMPLVPYLTARHHIARLDVMMPSYTTPDQFRDVCTQVIAKAQWVVIDRLWIQPANLLILHPAMADANPPEKQAFEAALMQGFGRIATSSHFEVRQRMPTAVPSLCDGIGGAKVAQR
jgi:hypothetical protein